MEKQSNRLKCSVNGCNNKKTQGFSMHTLPKISDLKRRSSWIKILKIDEENLPSRFVVCSQHFKPTDFHRIKDEFQKKHFLRSHAVPSQNLPKNVNSPDLEMESTESMLNLQEFGEEDFQLGESVDLEPGGEKDSFLLSEYVDLTDNCEPIPERIRSHISAQQEHIQFLLSYISFQQDIIKDLVESNNKVKLTKEKPASVDKELQVNTLDDFVPTAHVFDFIKNDKDLNCWTGVSSFKLLESFVENILLMDSSQQNKFKVSLLLRTVLFFIKIKTGLTFSCIATLFHISKTTCSKYFYDIIPLLRYTLNFAIKWPTKSQVQANMPEHFIPDYTDTIAVLDCTEIGIKCFGCVNCKTDAYSQYKGKHTAKFLVCVSPDGTIIDVSQSYPGRCSDKFIFNNEKIINKLVPTEDAIMVDKGFAIDDECRNHAIKLYRPPFLRNNKQLSKEDAENNYKIAKARIHVERANQRIKIFNILSFDVDANILGVMDEIMFIICALVNLSPPILGDEHFD